MYEAWKSISGYEGIYEISNCGRVRSLDRMIFQPNGPKGRDKERRISGKVLKPCDNGNGYLIVHLKREGRREARYIHRLVADAFLQKEKDENYVNHKDFDKKNNHVTNLEWCSQGYNVNYSSENMRKPHKSLVGAAGEKYVYFNKCRNFVVRIRKRYIGTFKTLEEAVSERDKYI